MINRIITKWNPEKQAYERQVSEKDVVAEIMARLAFAKIPMFIFRENLPTGYRMSDAGIPDLHGRIPKEYKTTHIFVTGYTFSQTVTAIPVYIEVKRPGEMDKFNRGVLPNKRMQTIYKQKLFIEQAQRDGCVACFAESWAEVCVEFEKHGIILPNK